MDRETRLQLFGDLAFFAMNFEQLIQDFIQRNIQMLNYISPMFVNNWDMTSVINNAKSQSFQKGYGIGGWFKRLFRSALPFLSRGAKSVGKKF
ncbi:hypothetical protein TNCV_672101 [Trichonephila clavipes]|nr:hypothetical protein TNCV_672101 [Trichonephila clavipes]